MHAVPMSDTNDYQRPEGRLLAAAMARTGQSARRIAEQIGISDTRLRHIVNGYSPVGRGQKVEAIAPPTTLARIAATLDITAEELVRVGRTDAAEILQEMPAHAEPPGEPDWAEQLRSLQHRVEELERRNPETG